MNGRLVDLRDTPLSVDECLAAVATPAAGGVATFIGNVRDTDGGRGVTALEYEGHPAALSVLNEVVDGVLRAYPVEAVAVVHRLGRLVVGDTAVVVVVAAAHRSEAFAACRRLIDDLKAQVPIWKHQIFADGSREWVGAPVGTA